LVSLYNNSYIYNSYIHKYNLRYKFEITNSIKLIKNCGHKRKEESETITQLRISNNRYSVNKYLEYSCALGWFQWYLYLLPITRYTMERRNTNGKTARRRGIDHGASVVYSLERDRTRLIFPNGRHAISRALTRIGPNRR